jgi:glycosyltransferase involved in cell wall biosynthesis
MFPSLSTVATSDAPRTDSRVDVLVIMPSLVRGGLERVVLRLLAGFDPERYAPRLLLFGDDGRGYPRPEDTPVEVLRTNSLRSHIPELGRMWRRQPPQIVLAHGSGPSVVALLARRWARRRFPVVSVSHIPVGQEHARRRDPVMRIAFKRTLRSADAVVAVSAGAARDLEQFMGWEAGRVRVLPNVVIDETVMAEAAEPVEHRWFRPELRVVLGAGRLTEQKDFPTLLRAFARVASADPSLRLLVLGEGPDRSELEALVAELGISAVVELPGAVPNPFAYMSRSSLLVLSSAWEALPTVLVEALAVGLPVVATDCVAGPREILRDGSLGALVPVKDERALADAIASALEHPLPAEALRAGAAAYGRAAVRSYELLIDELLAPAMQSRAATASEP